MRYLPLQIEMSCWWRNNSENLPKNARTNENRLIIEDVTGRVPILLDALRQLDFGVPETDQTSSQEDSRENGSGEDDNDMPQKTDLECILKKLDQCPQTIDMYTKVKMFAEKRDAEFRGSEKLVK